MISLTEKELEIVVSILKKYASGLEILIFGSRHTGNTHPHSDLDIALRGNTQIDILVLADIRDAFQESNLPFRVDIVDFNRICPDFQEIILASSTPLEIDG